jgi:hypothetical protein
MKSSPFKLFSLSAREADQRGNYANPELGRYKATTFDHPDLSGIKNSKPKAKTEDPNTSSYEIPIKEFKTNFGETPDMPNLRNGNSNSNQNNNSSSHTTTVTEVLPYGTNYPGPKMSDNDWNNLNAKQKRAMNANVGANEEGIIGHDGRRTTNTTRINNSVASNSGANFNGSPVKHNAGAVGSIAGANPLAGGIAGIGQQISNQAQQRAADAGGSTSVDPFLPPPNQVAETGSYGSGGDRDMLEMNGNQINNQSIGRNTDITSQLFGSGQRASMLAMKGTPLHTEGHGGAKDHKHSPESKNPATPKYINGVDPYETADKSISSTDEPRRLEEGEIGAPTEREQSDRDYLAEFDMEYKASGGNLYVPKKR